MIEDRLNIRRWLNPPSLPDMGSVQIEAFVDVDANGGGDPEAEVYINDCFRVAHLHFGFYDKVSYRRRLKKLRILIDALLELEKWMIAHEPEGKKK